MVSVTGLWTGITRYLADRRITKSGRPCTVAKTVLIHKKMQKIDVFEKKTHTVFHGITSPRVFKTWLFCQANEKNTGRRGVGVTHQ